jgi:hypothetical protein
MENFICSNCNYSLTIKKTSDAKTNIVVIENSSKFIDYYRNRRDENNQLDIKFNENDLENYFAGIIKNKVNNADKDLIRTKNKVNDIKINDADKDLIRKFYRNNIKKNISKYNLLCSTCGHEYVLKPETIIYSLNFKNQHSTFNDDIEELVELKFNDPTLPRTKDYICQHPKCESNQVNFDTSKKEAVMYRANRSFHMKYACLVCKGPAWHI